MMLIEVIDESGGVREAWFGVNGLCILWSVMIREFDVGDRMVLFDGFEWSGVLSLDYEWYGFGSHWNEDAM